MCGSVWSTDRRETATVDARCSNPLSLSCHPATGEACCACASFERLSFPKKVVAKMLTAGARGVYTGPVAVAERTVRVRCAAGRSAGPSSRPALRPLVARPGKASVGTALSATLQEGIAKFYDESTPRADPGVALHVKLALCNSVSYARALHSA